MPNILQTVCQMLVHYYKTKFEVSGEDAPLNFLTSLYQIQNDQLLETSIGLIYRVNRAR